jgi:hypothetical protein
MDFGQDGDRLRGLEESAKKERRELETRQNAEELHNFLDFADIDWDNIKPEDFEVKNFDDTQEEEFEDNSSYMSGIARNLKFKRNLNIQTQVSKVTY